MWAKSEQVNKLVITHTPQIKLGMKSSRAHGYVLHISNYYLQVQNQPAKVVVRVYMGRVVVVYVVRTLALAAGPAAGRSPACRDKCCRWRIMNVTDPCKKFQGNGERNEDIGRYRHTAATMDACMASLLTKTCVLLCAAAGHRSHT